MSEKNIKRKSGFTLLELMVTVAIIAIIAAIAIPSYIDYTKKSHYSELVRATASYKLGVVQCYNVTGSFEKCNSGNTIVYGIPPSISAPPTPQSTINKIFVTQGIITAVPNSIHGMSSEQIYILTPKAAGGLVSWTASGKGINDGLAN